MGPPTAQQEMMLPQRYPFLQQLMAWDRLPPRVDDCRGLPQWIRRNPVGQQQE